MAETHLKERILQIGEGRFLRGFIGRIAGQLNRSGAGIGITVVKPRAGEGIISALNANSAYNLQIRGLYEGKTVNETYKIDCIVRGLNLISDYDSVEQAALSLDLRVIISNTTEAGIVYRAGACTYPYYLTKLLYARFSAGLELPVVLPCELIENNGKKLREYVLKYAADLGCDEAFILMLALADFPNTLVDSIVTSGDDETGVCAEPYYSWVIEYNPAACIRKLIEDSGVNIVFTDDIRPYRRRKVAILNGAHTMSVMAGRMCGFETVREMMSDAMFAEYIARGVSEEVLPTLTLPREETEAYAREVIERFRNPFLQHKLKDIALNSIPKAKARIIPTLLRYNELYGKPPRLLTMAVSALIAYTILTPSTHTPAWAVERIQGMWQAAGSNVELMEPAHHDVVLAAISHLPHAAAFSLVNAVLNLERAGAEPILKYAAGGFLDFTRIASSDPAMWRDIFLQNGTEILNSVSEFEMQLRELRRFIETNDAEGLTRWMSGAKAARDGLVQGKMSVQS